MAWGRRHCRACVIALAALAALAPAAAAAGASQLVLVQPSGTVAAAGDAVEAAGGEVQLTGGGLVQALVPTDAMPALRASGAVEGIDPAPVATPDAVTSFGSARVGAPALQAAGLRGAGVKIAVLDQAFGLVSRLDDLAGTELPALPLQHRRTFDATYGLAGRDYNGNTSRHGEFVAEIVHDVAPDAELWFVNYRTHLEFDQAVTYLIDEVHPDIVVHSNSFLFGPFDGSGWFARRVDRAAAAGIMWVNSVGNYRERHFEGPFADADGDDVLDVAGHGEAFPVALIATSRPSCDLTWTGAAANGHGYVMGLFQDPEGQNPVVDARSGLPVFSTPVADPEPHATIDPAYLSGAGTYYLRVVRDGGPPGAKLTLFCRFSLPAPAASTTSSVPTPGDARGSLSVGAFDADKLTFEGYSSEGPTDDGRGKPDIAAPTNVAYSGGRCGGTSCAAPHVAGAAALLWRQTEPAAGQSRGEAVARRLYALARDDGAPGFDLAYGNGRLLLETDAPQLAAESPAPGSPVRGVVSAALRFSDASGLGPGSLALDGRTLAALTSDGFLRATIDTLQLPDGPHTLLAAAQDIPGNAASVPVGLLVDNHAPSLAVTVPRRVVLGLPLRVRVAASDPVSGLSGAPAVTFGDGATAAGTRAVHVYRKRGPYVVRVRQRDRAGNEAAAARRVQVAALLLEATGGRRPAAWIRLGRRATVTLVATHGSERVRVVRRLRPGLRRVALDLGAGRWRIVARTASGAAARLLVVRR